MKKVPVILALVLLLSACDGWVNVAPTFPVPPDTSTPGIHTPTPLFVTATSAQTGTPPVSTPTATETDTPFPTTENPDPTLTPAIPSGPLQIQVELLGCDTSFDISHGMGEVTNAYVRLKNASEQEVTELCTTLYALDEGREHPDKTVCLDRLPGNHQVDLKLTVDSTYRRETPIQVELSNDEGLIARVGHSSCTDVGLFAPAPETLMTPVPIP